MNEATERATYYERNKDRLLEKHKIYYRENKDKILEKQKRTTMCIAGRLIIHEELLKKDRERLKTTFIQEQIEELNINTNKINKDR